MARSRKWFTHVESGPSQWGWALLLLLAVLLAALFRFYQLGHWPPGLYRDEAFNGLDAAAVLRGDWHLFFPANNGREPLYIYLIAIAIALLGSTVIAVRLPAAIVGTLTTLPTYLLGRDWFGRTTGLLAAFIWAVTFWPVHLSRIGLRTILLAPLLALAFWLGTRAYRTGRGLWWGVAGAIYGLTFYTYLAARFTPLILVAVALYLLLTGRRDRLWANGQSLWFLAGAAVALAPLAFAAIDDPGIIMGRTGQVFILDTGDPGGMLSTLWSQTGKALGMFFWRGDNILRHNALLDYSAASIPDASPGRPVFDLFMVGPFLLGVGWCLWRWRRPAVATLLLWQIIMLGPTILTEDTPHFLRAAGLLPGLVLLPAIGLNAIWQWPHGPAWVRRVAVIGLLAGSAFLTARDYAHYGRQPEVGYLFESAASDLATSAMSDTASADVYLDQRFWEGWPSIPFLLEDKAVTLVNEADVTAAGNRPVVRYAWPYGSLVGLQDSVTAPANVDITVGPLARGDLEPEAYSLYTRYEITPGEIAASRSDNFDGRFELRGAGVTAVSPTSLQVDLTWGLPPDAPTPDRLPAVFIHVLDETGLVAQGDSTLAGGLWPVDSWQPGITVTSHHLIELPEPFDPAHHQVTIGLYWPDSQERLPLLDSGYTMGDDQVTIWPPDAAP
ncbi:MAG: glycosyltransferase family 39 protein [Chloroflexota bacterium]